MPRILLVEDSPTQAAEIQLVLESRRRDLSVDVARDGKSGLELARRIDFDLVLSDVVMPHMSGYELCAAIRHSPAGRRLPVLLLTTLSEPVDILRGLQCGASGYVTKPCAPDELLRRIDEALGDRPRRYRRREDGAFEFELAGERHVLDVDPEQMLELLGATFDEYVQSRRREQALLQRQRERLTRTSRFLEATLNALSERVCILDERGRILAVNNAWTATRPERPLFGPWFKTGDDYVATCELVSSSSPEAARLTEALRAALRGEAVDEPIEHGLIVDGEPCWLVTRLTHFDDDGAPRIVVTHEDVTAVRRAAEALRHAAYHDALTSLHNRAWFEERLADAVECVRDNPRAEFAVLFIDLDRFKVINDSLGHAVGDEVLVETARRIEACLRPGDEVARLGGDEFTVLLQRVDLDRDVEPIAERILSAMSRPFVVAEREVFVSASIGVTTSQRTYRDATEVLRDADLAMYRAKQRGRARFERFDTRLRDIAVDKLERQSELRRAISTSAFELHLEPILTPGDPRRVVGFDAQAFWSHPSRGALAPAAYLETADELGLRDAVDDWTLSAALGALSRRRRARREVDARAFVVVTLAPTTLERDHFVDRLLDAIAGAELETEDVRIALAENDLAQASPQLMARLTELRAFGVALVLDAPGRGRSALTQLYRLPLDALRLDLEHLDEASVGSGHLEVVTSLARLARDLGLRLYAREVSQASQLGVLEAVGCHAWHGPLASQVTATNAGGEVAAVAASA